MKNFAKSKGKRITAALLCAVVWAWIKSEFLMPKKLVFHSTNTYFELMKPSMEQKSKEVLKTND